MFGYYKFVFFQYYFFLIIEKNACILREYQCHLYVFSIVKKLYFFIKYVLCKHKWLL